MTPSFLNFENCLCLFLPYKTTFVLVRTSIFDSLSLQARTVGRCFEEEGGHRQCPYCDLTDQWVTGTDGHIW